LRSIEARGGCRVMSWNFAEVPADELRWTSLREEKVSLDCKITKNRPQMGSERLVDLSTISNGSTGLSVSLDGFIADKKDDVSEVFAWMGRAMEHFHEIAGDQLNEGGVVIMGHRSFQQIDNEQGWIMPDGTPLPGPVVVLQSQARDPLKQGQTQYYFVTDGIESALAKARELAGEKNIALHGASAVQQALKAGLLDEFHMSIAHVLLGEGVRLFDHLGSQVIHVEHLRTVESPGATHLSFRVVK
jgi:dihydrofolate reductase